MYIHQHFRSAIISLGVLLAACGGGGGGGGVDSTSSLGDMTTITDSASVFNPVYSRSVIDSNGVAYVAWLDFDGLNPTTTPNNTKISVRRGPSSGGWGSTVTLAESLSGATGHYLLAPEIGVDGAGNVIVVWENREDANRSIHAKRYTPSGGWENSATTLRSGSSAVDLYPQLAVAANGDAMVVWQESDGLKSKAFTVAGGWSASIVPVGSVTYALVNYMNTAADSNGNFMALWSNGSGVQAWLYTAGGGWSGATALHAEAGDVAYPRIQFDSNGNALAMWLHDGDATAARNWQIVVNRYVTSAGWGTATRYSTLNAGSSTSANLRMRVDASGNALTIWDNFDGTTNTIQGNRFVPGVGWGTTAVVIAGGYVGSGDLAVDAQGNGRAVWLSSDTPAICSGGYRSLLVSRSFSSLSGWSVSTEQHTDGSCKFGGSVFPVTTLISSNASGDMVGILEFSPSYLAAYRYQ